MYNYNIYHDYIFPHSFRIHSQVYIFLYRPTIFIYMGGTKRRNEKQRNENWTGNGEMINRKRRNTETGDGVCSGDWSYVFIYWFNYAIVHHDDNWYRIEIRITCHIFQYFFQLKIVSAWISFRSISKLLLGTIWKPLLSSI